MKIDLTKIKDFAAILYAFEDPDSTIPNLEQNTSDFNNELKAYQEMYLNILPKRKKNLEQAVLWILTQKINSKKDLPKLVPDLYRKIWNHEEDTKMTETIIKTELDEERYIKAISYIFKQALAS